MVKNTIYITVNQDGFVTAFYQSAAYDNPEEIIPASAIEISEEQFSDLYTNFQTRKLVDGEVVVYTPPPPPPVIPDRVTRRQFRLQLIDAGLLSTVEGWIATQDERTQAAYADSGTFLRSDEMLQTGFAALGFTTEQIDSFFTEAAGL
ncbi:hypothetical protein SAMN05428967_2263 [Phyllobacterium sp. YR620]|uniref:hypothetical protein n=1 Tax=Phyllobacterium sp. YR620 TaxID=1881066 RepID=UPI00087F30D9|nr:hypothetical protein [Phyllobacterium sp. YR620]SDP47039.1 hypothetical protein SAMN05428967_2263 [Phyllobacterium sp. YR620]